MFLISVLFPQAVHSQQQQDKQGTITLSSQEDIANFKKMLEEKTRQHIKGGGNGVPAAQPEDPKNVPENPAFSDKDGVIVLKSQEDIKKFDEYLDKSGFDDGKVQPAGDSSSQSTENK